MKQEKPREGTRGYLEGVITRADGEDDDDRTVEIAFSSETPVDRFYGSEILSHEKGAMRAGRIDGGTAPLLFNHNPDVLLGVVDSARIDQDKRGRAVVRFSEHGEGPQALAQVRERVLANVSVGYRIWQTQETDLKGGGLEIRITDWEPIEISMVAAGADSSAAVGRSTGAIEDTSMPTKDVAKSDDVVSPVDGDIEKKADEITKEITGVDKARERDDATIRALGERFDLGTDADDLIAIGGSVKDMQERCTIAFKARNVPKPMDVTRQAIITGGMPAHRPLRAFRNAGEDVAYRSGQWCLAQMGVRSAQTWCNENNVRTMTEGVFSKGGALVPEEMEQVIIDLREEYGSARQLSAMRAMRSDTLSVPRRAGDVTAYFVGEGVEPTASDTTYDMINLVAKKLGSETRVSSELLEDSPFDVAQDVADNLARVFAEKEDDCWINGDGTSTYGGIYGLAAKVIDGNHAASAIDGASGIDTFAEVTVAELQSLMGALPIYAQMNANWLTSNQGWANVFQRLAEVTGGATMGERAGVRVNQYAGYDIHMSQKAPTSTGDLSNVLMLALGDFTKAVSFGDRRGIEVRFAMERYIELDLVGVFGFERFDIVWHDLGDASTAGPVVCLIGE